MSSFFSEFSTRNRNRDNASLLALRYQSDYTQKQMATKAINSFYSRQSSGIPSVPNYLENSIYSQLLKKQHSLYMQIRDPEKLPNKRQRTTAAEMSDDMGLADEDDSWWSSIERALFNGHSATNNKESPTPEEFEALRLVLPTDFAKLTKATQDLRLPTVWDTASKGENIDISVDCLKLTYKGNGRGGLNTISSVRANHPIKKQCGIYYFEIQILSKNMNTEVSIGICGHMHSFNRFPGTDDYSWGYHGGNGNVYAGLDTEKPYGPTYGSGDIIGCGVDYRNMSIFYTKNGVFLGTAFLEIKESIGFYPCIGFESSGETATVNFGSRPFRFDICHYLSTIKREFLDAITFIPKTKITSTIISNSFASNVADEIILEYLRHNGYDNTAKSLENGLKSKGNYLREDDDFQSQSEDSDLRYRKEISSAVLHGKINRVFKLCKKYYPGVLEKNPMIVLKLQCREFMEMVKRSQQHSIYLNSKDEEHELQLLKTSENINEGSSKRRVSTFTSKDSNSRMKKLKLSKQKPVDFSHILDYGHRLRAQYEEESKTDDTIKSELMAAFSTLAYTDLKDPAVAYLYESPRFESVASELNSAILVSLGEFSSSSLERLYRQTNTVLDELVLTGDAKAALLQPEKDCLHYSSNLM